MPLSDVVYCVTVAFTVTERTEREEKQRLKNGRKQNELEGSRIHKENVLKNKAKQIFHSEKKRGERMRRSS